MDTEPINIVDRLKGRIKRASDILHPYTSHNYDEMPERQAVNDAFNVLEWGKTIAEEAAEATEAAGGNDANPS